MSFKGSHPDVMDQIISRIKQFGCSYSSAKILGLKISGGIHLVLSWSRIFEEVEEVRKEDVHKIVMGETPILWC